MPLLIIKNHPYTGDDALYNVVSYVLRCGHTGGVAVDPAYAVEQMALVKELWHKTDGRQVRHFILSFADSECLDYDEAMQYGNAISQYYGSRFQIVFGLHLDTQRLHLHFAMNTVSFIDGQKYSEGITDWWRFRTYVQEWMPQWTVKSSIS